MLSLQAGQLLRQAVPESALACCAQGPVQAVPRAERRRIESEEDAGRDGAAAREPQQQESLGSKRTTSPPQPAPEKARPNDRMQELASQPRKVLEQPDDGRGGGFE